MKEIGERGIPAKQLLSTKRGAFACGAIWGMILFVLLYGTKILNVTYDEWLLTGGDLSQHYIGWMCYRNSAWTFPLGMMDSLSYPNFTSVIYTDSIPHFALIFKLLSPILPETFQYFGLFGLFSYAMMGGFSCLLLKHFLHSLSVSLVLSSLLIYSPYVLQRMYGHTSLASQWIIVASLYLWLCRPFTQNCPKKASAWMLLAFTAGGIHPYFLPMVAILCGCACLDDLLCKAKWKQALIIMGSMLLGGVTALALYGAFGGGTQKYNDGIGYYNSNLNTLFDPQGTSRFLMDLSHSAGQYEGYGYLGLGIIILFMTTIIAAVCLRNAGGVSTWKKSTKISLAVALIVFSLAATFPNFELGSRTLLYINLPQKISHLLGIFRSQGRFIWCVCYILFLISIVNIFTALDTSKLKLRGVAVFIVAVQILDLSPELMSIHYAEKYQNYVTYSYADIDTTSLETLFQAGKTKIIYYPCSVFTWDDTGRAVAAFAMKNNGKVSYFHFARTDAYTDAMAFEATIGEELSNGISREDCIYVFSSDNADLSNYDLEYYTWNNYIIGLSEEHSELETTCGLQHLNQESSD